MRPLRLLALVCLLMPLPLLAGHATPAPKHGHAIGAACSSAVFRQFDFWLGRWVVTNPAGKVVGHSRITRISGGCAVHEHWMGAQSTGHSLNYYEAGTQAWHQDWVGSGGQILHLHGGLHGRSMVLSDRRSSKEGPLRDRITWSPLAGHRVRQHWEISTDKGKTWKTAFDGVYSPDTTGSKH